MGNLSIIIPLSLLLLFLLFLFSERPPHKKIWIIHILYYLITLLKSNHIN